MSENDDGHKIDFIANPTQRQFIESRAQADLFSSRKGEGKSAALVWAIFYHTKHNPGATWLVIRDTWENLKRTTLEEFYFWFPEGVYGDWIAGDKMFVWNTARTGLKGKIYWFGVDGEEDANKIASMPLAGIAVDEPSPATGSSSGVPEFVFDTAHAQLRQPGMNWYAAKLAQNNPDESHWTYPKFTDPGTPHAKDKETGELIELLPHQEGGYRSFQTKEPENLANLPPGYYSTMEQNWKSRPDLIRRFVTGGYGYQQVGKPVTPQWSDDMHLANELEPVKGVPLWLFWDGGLNPTCLITQVTPQGYWLILEAHVLDGVGMFQLIEDIVKPRLTSRFAGYTWTSVGDPNLNTPEQSDSRQSAASVIRNEIGGRFIRGVNDISARVDPLRSVLTRTMQGTGVVQVDRRHARKVWFALRGGWHYHKARSGVVGNIVKDEHSHPGDCMGYGAAKLFPQGRLQKAKKKSKLPKTSGYFNTAPHPGTSMGMRAARGTKVPKEARTLGDR
jgi:hypothetical protein